MSRRTKFVVGYTVLMLVVVSVIRFITGDDNWLGESIATTITFAFGLAIGYNGGKED